MTQPHTLAVAKPPSTSNRFENLSMASTPVLPARAGLRSTQLRLASAFRWPRVDGVILQRAILQMTYA
jgi:hypothetical protein